MKFALSIDLKPIVEDAISKQVLKEVLRLIPKQEEESEEIHAKREALFDTLFERAVEKGSVSFKVDGWKAMKVAPEYTTILVEVL